MKKPSARQIPRKNTRARVAANGGYQKGEDTRERILNVALKAFGEASFLAVTTRQIADAASVSLPVLQYYFGNKEGLYRACGEAVVDRYRRSSTGAAAQARAALKKDCSSEIARGHLKSLIQALAGLLMGSQEVEGWSHFVTRELRDPGPAFEILYERLWHPGLELTARLIGRILGSSERDPAVRIKALLLISSLLAFQSGRSISLRAMHWSAIGSEELSMILAVLDMQIDAIGGHLSS
jgi:TetR/AcrR family transcriptional regulator, regulator of cefoperazone and chloramphenicol sensitivity